MELFPEPVLFIENTITVTVAYDVVFIQVRIITTTGVQAPCPQLFPAGHTENTVSSLVQVASDMGFLDAVAISITI